MFYSTAALTQSLNLFVEIQNTVSSLQSTSNNIQLELTAAQKNLTDAQDSCKNSEGEWGETLKMRLSALHIYNICKYARYVR